MQEDGRKKEITRKTKQNERQKCEASLKELESAASEKEIKAKAKQADGAPLIAKAQSMLKDAKDAKLCK